MNSPTVEDEEKKMFTRRILFLGMITITAAALFAQSLPDSVQNTTTTAVNDTVICAWFSDSTLTSGSSYGSFADIFQSIPGSYFFNRGSVGQPAYGQLFSGSPSMLRIFFDGLLLQDPICGLTDLYWIPAEAVGELQYLPTQLAATTGIIPSSTTLFIQSRYLASLPIRSRIAYRSGGQAYDDIDARFGIRFSRRLRINTGEELKNYAGTIAKLEKYRARAKSSRRFCRTNLLIPSFKGSTLNLLANRQIPWPISCSSICTPHESLIIYL